MVGALAAGALLAPAAHATDPAQEGRWSALQQYPVIPISAAVLPDGNIVAWDQADPNVPHGLSPNNGKAIVIDPDKGVVARSANLAPTSVFCTLITTLPDGKVALVGGGNETYNSDRTVLYDPRTKTFGAWGDISRGRWYPGGQIDKLGNIVALGGRGGSGADVVDASTGLSRRLDIPFGATYYPHVLRMPDGRFTVESISQTNAPIRSILDTTGQGSLTAFSDRTLLQPRLRLTSTMVGPYTMLGIGGGTLRTTYTLDVSSGRPVAKASGTLKYPRITATSVTLPDGSALVVGGNSSNSETIGTPVMTPELWSPSTGQWAPMADSPRQRQYHSVSALLPDGRVWSAGTSARGTDEYNGAYFTPPYLFKKDGSGELAARPAIQDAPASVAWGERFSVRSPQAASIRRAALIRVAANTHQYSFDQTYVPLDVQVDGDRVSMTVPANGNTIPAGQYMLFLVDSAGVPSKAPIVRVDPAPATQPHVVVTQSSQLRTYRARRAYDGDTRNTVNSDFNGSHTLSEPQPWWQVDFGRSRTVERITIYTRTDRFLDRTRNVWVFASDEPLRSTSIDATRAQPGVTAIQLPGIQPATVTVPLNRTARYIRIQLPHTDHLNLREVVPQFGADPAPDTQPDPAPAPDPQPEPAPAPDPDPTPPPEPDPAPQPDPEPAPDPAPAGQASFAVSPANLQFSGTLQRGPAPQTASIRNDGTAAGAPGPIALSNATSSFAITATTCGTVAGDQRSVTAVRTLAVGASCTITVSMRTTSLLSQYGSMSAGGKIVTLSGRLRLL